MSSDISEKPDIIESVFERRVFGSGSVKQTTIKLGSVSTVIVKNHETGEPPTSIEMVRLVGQGMRGRYLQRLSAGIPRKVLASTLGTAISNFPKYYERQLSKVQTDEINDLTLIWSELDIFFNGDDELRDEWLESPIPALSGSQPLELLSTIVGRQILRKTLDAMRHGEFA